MLENQLKQLGFNKNEIKVYLAMFDFGKCKAGEIVKQTGLHCNSVYVALDELIKKNIVSKMDNGKVAIFELNDPGILKELVEEKMSITRNVIEELRGRLVSKPRDVRVYDGDKGIIIAREKVAKEIKNGEEYYVMGASYENSNPELEKFFPKLNKKITDKGGIIKVLIAGNENKKIITDRGLAWQKNGRYLPFDVNSPMWVTLFRDTMNISVVGTEPVTFSICSQEAADGFKKYFEYFWDQEILK